MTHPLTDDIIHTMWGKGDPSQKLEYRLARAAADWQLEQVVEWLEEEGYCIALRVRLMEALRPQGMLQSNQPNKEDQ